MMNWKKMLLAVPVLALGLTVPAQADDHGRWRKHSERERREQIARENRYRYNNRYNNSYGYNNGYYNSRPLPRGLDRNRNGVDDRVERRDNRYYNNSPYWNYRR